MNADGVLHQVVQIGGVVEEMTADAHAADIRGVAQRDQYFALAQEVDQRGILRGSVEREGDDAGAIARALPA